MSLCERIFISVMRHKLKSCLFISLVMLMSGLIATSMIVRSAISSTDKALRSRLPAVATLRLDVESFTQAQDDWFQQTGEWLYPEAISSEMIRELGSLPYVQMFDFSATSDSFYSLSLKRFFDQHLFDELFDGDHQITDEHSYRQLWGVNLERFTLRGVENPRVLDIDSGLIDLVAGRTFTEEEMLHGEHVVLVSQPFLQANELNLGDVLTLDHRIFGPMIGDVNMVEYLSDENLYLEEVFEFEIIGIFDRDIDEVDDFYVWSHIGILNTVYVPNNLVIATFENLRKAWYEDHREFLSDALLSGNVEEAADYSNIVFLLYDPLYLPIFSEAVQSKSPDFWIVADLSNAYANIAHAMLMINDVFQLLFTIATGAMLIFLTLIVSLFLRDRRQEIGIYLALGERKSKAVAQFLIEVTMLCLIGITLGLLIGYKVSEVVSTAMIRTELIRQEQTQHTTIMLGATPESMGFRHRMTHEEMLSLYDTSIDISTVALFYVIAISTVLVASILPMIFITKMHPKDTLIITKGS